MYMAMAKRQNVLIFVIPMNNLDIKDDFQLAKSSFFRSYAILIE